MQTDNNVQEPSNENDAVKSVASQLGDIVLRVVDKIKASENILVALSKNPSVDEIAGAISISMILDKLGKHVTAIYSGKTPNTLEFLKPDETFESDTNSLQDFIVAISKEKVDHLRYKIEGDFVKVYITPYRTVISEKDLEYERGDYNVDLVITFNVESGDTIDAALAEYGRIMHDATAINITTSVPGHFAETEWVDPSVSSVCEMVMILAEKLEFKDYNAELATALLTGIVAATDRFSNNRTASSTMALASRLMEAGADQQLISTNIMAATGAVSDVPDEVTVNAPAEPASEGQDSLGVLGIQGVQPPVPPAVISGDSLQSVAVAGEPLIPEPALKIPEVPTVSDETVPAIQFVDTPVAQENPVVPEAKGESLPMPDFNAAPPAPNIDFSGPSMPPSVNETPTFIAPEPVITETPKPEVPVSAPETPIVEPPKLETPIVEPPKLETSEPEVPKPEIPKITPIIDKNFVTQEEKTPEVPMFISGTSSTELPPDPAAFKIPNLPAENLPPENNS